MVGGNASGAVVARIKTACAGGSSRVLRNAFAPSRVNMCASSMMKTFIRIDDGANFTDSRSARISSIPRFDAASTSMTSSAVPASIARQFSHVLSGSGVGPCTQSIHRAKILAADVFPLPRGPENRYACAILPEESAVRKVRTTASWPTRSVNDFGRHVRYKDTVVASCRTFRRPWFRETFWGVHRYD